LTKKFLKNDPNFSDTIQILNKLKINYWVCHGTLLGLMRDKSLISWDNDIDIGSWEIKDKNDIINAFVAKGFKHKTKKFGNNNLISFEKGKNRAVDINFYELDKSRKYCFQRHYAIRNIFCRAVYVLSVSKNYNGRFKVVINKFGFLTKFFKRIKKILEKMNFFYVDAGFKTKKIYFQHFRYVNYYGIKVKIPIFYKKYFEDLYGIDWRIPDDKYYWEKNKNKKILS